MKLPLTFLTAVVVTRAFAASPTEEQIEFFEKHIRPVLAENCYSCHSEKAEKVKGSLKLDTPEAMLRGGSSGPASFQATRSGVSRSAIRYSDPISDAAEGKEAGPKEHRRSESCKNGSPDAAIAPGQSARLLSQRLGQHWAFQPLGKPSTPVVRNTGWVKTPVDRFILGTLEKKQLEPAAPADRRTLIRRVTYDLIGLPPTPAEVEVFLEDRRPEAYAELVEQLLASPHYGERWGRYWLDIARYADTK
jgi:hypothetical protein